MKRIVVNTPPQPPADLPPLTEGEARSLSERLRGQAANARTPEERAKLLERAELAYEIAEMRRIEHVRRPGGFTFAAGAIVASNAEPSADFAKPIVGRGSITDVQE
jgi:hypothetical protein